MRYFDRGGRRAVWVVHRRGGKDLTAMHQLVKQAHERRGMYWHVFPTFEQGRKAIWEGFRKDGKRIIDNVFPQEIVAKRNEQEMKVELKCGSIYRIIGSDKIEVVGAGPIGVVFSEYSVSKPKAWDLIAPMLRENEGWVSFVYTPRGNNHGKKLFDAAKRQQGWFCELLTLYDTRAYDPDQTIAEERAAGRPEALIRQEYLCDWAAANVGSVYGDLMEAIEKRGGLCEFQHEKDGVYTTWDLGISDATAVWFWRLNEHGVADLIDHFEYTGKAISHGMDEVEARGYKYVRHFLPHDARARSLQTGVSTVELFAERFGVENVTITPELSLEDGIQAARWLLQQKIRIHPRCGEGIEAVKQYHYRWDEDLKILSSKPEHDWSSHTADAFRYVACVVKNSELMARKPEPRKVQMPRPVNSFTLDEMWELHDREVRNARG